MRWFKWFFDRVCKQILIRLQEDNIYAKKIILPAIKTKWRSRILFKPNYSWAYLSHPQEIVRQMFAQIVSLRQITNIIYHVHISNNKNKHFPP